jgi:hypothetical protein
VEGHRHAEAAMGVNSPCGEILPARRHTDAAFGFTGSISLAAGRLRRRSAEGSVDRELSPRAQLKTSRPWPELPTNQLLLRECWVYRKDQVPTIRAAGTIRHGEHRLEWVAEFANRPPRTGNRGGNIRGAGT